MLILLLSISFCLSHLSGQEEMYWSDPATGKINLSTINSTSVETTNILSQSSVFYHEYEKSNRELYWSDIGKSIIVKANVDGTNQVNIIEDIIDPRGLSVGTDSRLYYVANNSIWSSDLNGGDQTILLDGNIEPQDLIYYNNNIFWSNFENNTLNVLDLATLENTTILEDVFNCFDVEVNTTTEELFWAAQGAINKSDLDGGNRVSLFSDFVNTISMDESENVIYWSSQIFNRVYKLNLSDLEDNSILISGDILNPRTIRIDPDENLMLIAAASYDEYIFSANLDSGNGITALAKTVVYIPSRIEVDTVNEKLYWINQKSSFINDRRANLMRSDLDGANIENLIENPEIERPFGLAIDVENGNLYWTEVSSEKIMRSNLDGEEIEEILTTEGSIADMAIDRERDVLFWVDRDLNQILKSDLDGGNIEVILNDTLYTPRNIFFNEVENSIYWVDDNTAILKAFSDGTDITTVIENEQETYISIFIDSEEDKLYYNSVFENDRIDCSDLNGENIETLVSIAFPGDIHVLSSKISSTTFIEDSTLRLFPNPVVNKVTIEWQKPIQRIELFDSTGKKLNTLKTFGTHRVEMDLTDHASGIYYVRVSNSNSSALREVIKILD